MSRWIDLNNFLKIFFPLFFTHSQYFYMCNTTYRWHTLNQCLSNIHYFFTSYFNTNIKNCLLDALQVILKLLLPPAGVWITYGFKHSTVPVAWKLPNSSAESCLFPCCQGRENHSSRCLKQAVQILHPSGPSSGATA